MARLKHYCDVVNGYAFKSDLFSDEGVPLVRQSNLKSGSIVFDGICYPSEITPSRFLLHEGDLCIGLSGSIENFGVVRSEQLPAAVNQRVAVLRSRPQKTLKEFVPFFVQSSLFANYLIEHLPSTTIANIDAHMVGNVPFPDHDIPTQKKITDFLDRETARIDDLIEKKNQQRVLLAEKAQVTIIDAVTRGLSQGAAMQTTGLDWLPIVPAHWRVTRIANLFCEANEPGSDGLPILSVSIHHGISDRELDDDERDRKVVHIEERTSYQRVRPGYLAYNMMRAWQGAVGVSTVDGLVSPAYVVAKPKVKIHTPFFQYLLRTPACIEEMRRGSKGITSFRLRLYWENFRQIVVILPPLPEQQEIAELANRIGTQTGHVSAVIKQSVELLREHRAALITAAVTGQIDLTSWSKQGNPTQELLASPRARSGPRIEQQPQIRRPFGMFAHRFFRGIGDAPPHLGIVHHDLHFCGKSSSGLGRHAFHDSASDVVLSAPARSYFEFAWC